MRQYLWIQILFGMTPSPTSAHTSNHKTPSRPTPVRSTSSERKPMGRPKALLSKHSSKTSASTPSYSAGITLCSIESGPTSPTTYWRRISLVAGCGTTTVSQATSLPILSTEVCSTMRHVSMGFPTEPHSSTRSLVPSRGNSSAKPTVPPSTTCSPQVLVELRWVK